MAKRNRSTNFETRTYSQNERQSTMNKITSYLRSLANRRASGMVTADDVHNYLTRDGVRAEQVRTRLSFINSVLRSPMFEQIDTVTSSRPAAKGRSISAWTVA